MYSNESKTRICVHGRSVSTRAPTASSPFFGSLLPPRRQYQRRFGCRPRLWSVSRLLFRDSTAAVVNPGSQQHGTTRMDLCQTMHCQYVNSELPEREGLLNEGGRELTVDAVQTTAGAISKHDVGERQGDLVQSISTPVDRYAIGKPKCVPARRCMTMDDLRAAAKVRPEKSESAARPEDATVVCNSQLAHTQATNQACRSCLSSEAYFTSACYS